MTTSAVEALQAHHIGTGQQTLEILIVVEVLVEHLGLVVAHRRTIASPTVVIVFGIPRVGDEGRHIDLVVVRSIFHTGRNLQLIHHLSNLIKIFVSLCIAHVESLQLQRNLFTQFVSRVDNVSVGHITLGTSKVLHIINSSLQLLEESDRTVNVDSNQFRSSVEHGPSVLTVQQSLSSVQLLVESSTQVSTEVLLKVLLCCFDSIFEQRLHRSHLEAQIGQFEVIPDDPAVTILGELRRALHTNAHLIALLGNETLGGLLVEASREGQSCRCHTVGVVLVRNFSICRIVLHAIGDTSPLIDAILAFLVFTGSRRFQRRCCSVGESTYPPCSQNGKHRRVRHPS